MLRDRQILPESNTETLPDNADMLGYRGVVEVIKEGVDLIAAGFPCQDESIAGKRQGIQYDESTGKAKTRSGLWGAVCRTLRLVRPRFALLENVAGLLSGSMGKVLGDMAEVGYDAEWHCIPASHVGAPHERDRVWIVANAQCERLSGYIGERTGLRGIQERTFTEFGNRVVSSGSGWPELSEHLRMGDGIPRPVDSVRSLGNSVVPQIPEIIGRAILEAEYGNP